MSENVLAVLTAKSVERILKEGGSQSWAFDRNNARRCKYAVCMRNAHADWTEGDEAHGSAFIVGRVKDITPSTESEGRWLIEFSEYALVDASGAWGGWRNPVKYTTDQELGLDVTELTFKPMPPRAGGGLEGAQAVNLPVTTAKPLTIAEAKQSLAVAFGVSPDAVEITIRG
jgi:hypothetical protein